MVAPVKGYKVTTPYGKKNARLWRWLGYHTGDDYSCPVGTSVYASRAGRVDRVTTDKSFGRYIRINHGGGVTSWYCHLNTRSVKVGQRVKTGQFIGRSGRTGNVTGAHLHYEERRNNVPRRPVYNKSTAVAKAAYKPPKFPKGIGPRKSKPSAVPLQKALKKAGYMPSRVEVNKNYGPETRKAVIRFHNANPRFRARGVSKDSRIGPKGWAHLFRKAYG